MNLNSDLPFWTVRNGLMRVYPTLERDVKCDALIIGGGISGALLAHRLISKGIDCVLIDRRDIGFGSTSASTALLQWEIDTPLHELQRKVKFADRAYAAGIESIERLQKLAGHDCGFAMRPSLQVAARASDMKMLEKEYEARRAAGLPSKLLVRSALEAHGVEGPGALHSTGAAEVDPYRLTHRLLHRASTRGLRIFDRTAALSYTHSRTGVTAQTDRNRAIQSRKIFFATGYETQEILPKKLVTFKSTYAFVSEPVAPDFWKDRALIWDTGDPYSYMRTTSDNRVLVGGGDDSVLDPSKRDRQIEAKTKKLLHRFHQLFPRMKIEPAFAWAGLFGSTRDGLGYIGPHDAFPNACFALGFGGNGITYSEIASRILTDLFLGKKNDDARIFRFDR
jgi:glycine/D-amino acid oxidase-like deaminating enzyme